MSTSILIRCDEEGCGSMYAANTDLLLEAIREAESHGWESYAPRQFCRESALKMRRLAEPFARKGKAKSSPTEK